MTAFWTMTDFDGKAYVVNPNGDTILQALSLHDARYIADCLNYLPNGIVRSFAVEPVQSTIRYSRECTPSKA